MDIIVRKAQLCDIPDILKMNDELNGAGATIESMKEALEDNESEIVFVAIFNNAAVGFICGQVYKSICYADGSQCEITELFVQEKYRRNGIAALLIKELELELLKNNAKEIIVKTGKKNIGAKW